MITPLPPISVPGTQGPLHLQVRMVTHVGAEGMTALQLSWSAAPSTLTVEHFSDPLPERLDPLQLHLDLDLNGPWSAFLVIDQDHLTAPLPLGLRFPPVPRQRLLGLRGSDAHPTPADGAGAITAQLRLRLPAAWRAAQRSLETLLFQLEASGTLTPAALDGVKAHTVATVQAALLGPTAGGVLTWQGRAAL